MVTPSPVRIMEDVDLAFQYLEIVYRENGDAVEGLADRNGHRHKVLGEGVSVRWGVTRTKIKVREFELTKNMFLHSDLLKLCMNKEHNNIDFFPDTTVFYD